MSLNSVDSNYYYSKPFLGLTSQKGGQAEQVAYYQGRGDVQTPNPYEGRSIFENINDLEARKSGNNSYAAPVQGAQLSSRGSAWEGFTVPVNNGTGELVPKLDERNWIA